MKSDGRCDTVSNVIPIFDACVYLRKKRGALYGAPPPSDSRRFEREITSGSAATAIAAALVC